MTVIVGRYLLLFISLAGLALSVEGRFSEEDITRFLDYIFRLHNAVRFKHNVPPLERTDDMDFKASQKYSNSTPDNVDLLGKVEFWKECRNSNQLDVAEAVHVFSKYYEQGNYYDYELHQNNRFLVEFTQIVWMETTHIGLMFIDEPYSYNVVAVYYPRGNIEETYTSNVLRPRCSQPATDPDIGLIYQTEKEKFMDNMLVLHNEFRAYHGVGPLIHDDEMDKLADSVLLVRAQLGPEYGVNRLENISLGGLKLGYMTVAKEVFHTWYETNLIYDYIEGPSSYDTDTFTQIVWESTERIGISVKQKVFKEYDFIVLYSPPGNIPGEYTSKVFEP